MAQKWWRHVGRASWTGALAAVCITAAAWAAGEGADEGDAAAEAAAHQPGAAIPGGISDANVVAAMHKGIDFLLGKRKNGLWELNDWTKKSPDGERGGETALVLYALLHAGDSLQDDPVYHAKLHWRGKELGPAVQWLAKNPALATYVAGLEASALTVMNKHPDDKGNDPMQPALESCKFYLLQAMGPDGGYIYHAPWVEKCDAAWEAYLAAALQGHRNGPERTALDAAMKSLFQGFGGPDMEVQKLAAQLRDQLKNARDSRAQAKIQASMKELQDYAKDLPEEDNKSKRLANEKKELQELESHNGNPAGLTTGSGKAKTPMTKQELQDKVDKLKASVAKAEGDESGHFVPLGDLSNGQYGTLGAWAVADYGLELPDRYWQVQDRFWRKLQHPDGGWSYGNGKNGDKASKNTMSVAGLASLYVCQEFLDNELRLIPKPDKNIEAGLAWLTAEYTGAGNYYYMYGVERVGLSSGLKFFGTKDWYKLGAAHVVSHQSADGSWASGRPTDVDTAYALLFLARGRNPVVFNKLQYDGPWNARTHDDAYATRWMSKRYEKPINWQVVNLQVSPEEWQDAPILLITGSVDPKFTKDDIAKLKEFVNAGGMIFSTADGNSSAFTNAIKKYASDIVDRKYEMRQLPRNHPLFSKELEADIPNPPPLLGMSNDVRELWIHSTTDVGADWQTRKFSSQNFDLAAALYFYASSRGSLRSKLQPLAVNVGTQKPARTIDLARIDYPGNADPEPGAWPRMAKLAQADFKTQVHLTTVPFANLDAKKYPLAHLTGTTRVTFTADDAKALKAYLDAGGLLFVDAAGGNADFAASCRDLIKQVYPHNALDMLPGDHPIYTGALPDGAPVEVKFRNYGTTVLHRIVRAGALEAVVANGRTRVLFSSWDICSGFLGTNTWGILGYAPETSQALARNILLYSQNPALDVIKDKGATAEK